MLDELPLFNKLTDREKQAVEALVGNYQTQLNGYAKELEQSILQKTGVRSMAELVSLLHRELTRAEVSAELRAKAVDHFLHDPRFERFQVFADQGIRILDNTHHEYLYVNQATENIIGWSVEEFMKGGLLFSHRRTHPWDLLQLVYTIPKVFKVFDSLSVEDKLNSRFSFDLRFRHKSGHYRKLQQHVYTFSLTDKGKPGLLTIVSTDISTLKTAKSMQYVFGVTRGNRFDKLLEGKTKAHGNPLSEREIEVLQLASQGLTETDISSQLNITLHTVKSHRKNMLQKTGCKNIVDIVRHAIVEGWI